MGNWWEQWWGVKLARVSVDPHITIFFREVGGFGGAFDIWLADSMPANGAEWSNQPVQQVSGMDRSGGLGDEGGGVRRPGHPPHFETE